MKKRVRVLWLCLAMAMTVSTLSGCKNDSVKTMPEESSAVTTEETKKEEKDKEDNLSGTTGKYAAGISPADLKKEYGVEDEEEVMPLYNVEQTESFTFEFAFNDYDYDIDLYDYVSIHTDYNCEEGSKIYYNAMTEVIDDARTILTVSPMSPALASEQQDNEYVYGGEDRWGNAPMYYMAVHYDMEADTPVKLDKPVVIPFTVKNEVNAPTLKRNVDSEGCFSLSWTAIEGAEKYNIYHLVTDATATGTNNEPVNGAQKGYDAGDNPVYLLYDASTTELTFNNFAGEGGGKSEVETTYGIVNSGQNYCVCGEYYVTAVVDGVESGMSNGVGTSDLIIPYKTVNDFDSEEYAEPSDFPSSVDVLNIDGSVRARDVIYEQIENGKYSYVIEGTALRGFVRAKADNAEPPVPVIDKNDGGDVLPESDVDMIPDNDIETIIGTEESGETEVPAETENEGTEPEETEESAETEAEEAEPEETEEPAETEAEETEPEETEEPAETEAEETEPEETEEPAETEAEETEPEVTEPEASNQDDENLIEKQRENTEEHLSESQDEKVALEVEGIYINADSAEEEWMALNLINGNEQFSLEAFPSLHDPNRLVDVFLKTMQQNPYVFGVERYAYDYSTFTFSVQYSYDHEELVAKQTELSQKAQKIVEETVTDSMSDEEKADAFYEYLEDNAVYDDDALSAAEESGFLAEDLVDFKDSFEAYGILVNGKGVCASYAASYRLLCDMAGVECLVATGYIDGNLPHAWNIINLDDKWYEVDCTNNYNVTGIDYFLYKADDEITEKSGYERDADFALDAMLEDYDCEDKSKDYYNKNNLVASDMDEYKNVLVNNIKEDTTSLAVRWYGEEADTEDVKEAILLAFNELGYEDRLSNVMFGVCAGFILIEIA
ncbi:MAG: hypothetical protein E7505_00780 [Ruminococcus sp.]|nr:hypothetical protein [Ruminococcus sp.]